MWKVTLAGAIAIGFAAAAGEAALACDHCDAGYNGHRYYRAYRPHFRYGYHEYYGFYDSGYRANADGGFYSVVGPRAYGYGKRRLRIHAHRVGTRRGR